MKKIPKKLKSWFRRYLPAEIIGTITAILFPTAVYAISGNTLLMAVCGTIGENIGFYGTMLVCELSKSHKKHGQLRVFKTLRNLFIEFGLAETADSFLIRPATMYFTISLIPNLQIGLLVGKIAADVIFYIPTIISYELRKKFLK
jgi:hypothetical protein